LELPRFFRIEHSLFAERLDDIGGAVRLELRRVLPHLPPGSRIAVTAGSRGVANIPIILRAICDELRAAGADPFLVPAMGTHGGATAPGQVALLASLGVTEERVGAPIRASMDVIVAGYTPSGIEVYMDRIASQADGIVVVERPKQHTDYDGRWESGMAKMMAIGLGKQAGAMRLHSLGSAGLRDTIPQAARVILGRAPIIAGLAILENGLGQTWRVVGVRPDELMERDAELLLEMKAHSPSLPFAEADVLLVDYVGKDISGTGMDTKTVGRMRIAGLPEPERPRAGVLAALDITDASHGNASGVGLADVITERLAGKIDHDSVRINTLASGFWERAKVPMALANDRDALEFALRFSGRPTSQARICRIRDTKSLSNLVVSEPLLVELDGPCQECGEYSLEFDAQGNLTDHERFPG